MQDTRIEASMISNKNQGFDASKINAPNTQLNMN
jgi:hypothetical protein